MKKEQMKKRMTKLAGIVVALGCLSSSLCGCFGYYLSFSYEERDRIVKILALIITILRIPRIKRNIMQNTSTNTNNDINNNINDDINNNF